jgi:hypothetical protein
VPTHSEMLADVPLFALLELLDDQSAPPSPTVWTS